MVKTELDYTEATIHAFKSNIARYLRAMEEGRCKGVIIKRYRAPVGVFILHPEAEKKRDRAQAEILQKHEAHKKAKTGSTLEQALDIMEKLSGPHG